MNHQNTQCPNCGSEEFITEPYRYDILLFDGTFKVSHSEIIGDIKIFCRGCSLEVNEEHSQKEQKVISQTH